MLNQFDLLVIGAGSGGLAAASQAAKYGKSVALVDDGPLGGTCVNVGCIPKKIMWYAGQLAEQRQLESGYGFQHTPTIFNFTTLVTQRNHYIKSLHQHYLGRLEKNNIQFIHGKAVFLDPTTVSIQNQHYTAKHIIIATGCAPRKPDIPGIEFAIDSDQFFALTTQPKKIAIIGAGYIAVELASILQQLGSNVKLLMRKDYPLRQFDAFLSNSLMSIMHAQGIELLPRHEVEKIIDADKNQLELHCKNQKTISSIDTVLFAIGRYPRTKDLNLAVAGVNTDDAGFIITDTWETTNVRHIYAVGDVTGKKLLTPVAVAAGRQLAHRLFGDQPDAHLDYDTIPTVIFTHPPIGSVGLSEEAAREKYGLGQINIYETQFNSLFYALSDFKVSSKMKLITEKKSGIILGCHLIDPHADEMLQGFSVAIKMGATIENFAQTMAIHPTHAEELILMLQHNG